MYKGYNKNGWLLFHSTSSRIPTNLSINQDPLKLYKKAKAKLRNDSSELIGRDKERNQIKEFWEVIYSRKFQYFGK